MAIIKCPECGRQISDKAPTCPSCGVEIAGKITKCPHCGEVYFSSQEMCPNCHEIAVGVTHPVASSAAVKDQTPVASPSPVSSPASEIPSTSQVVSSTSQTAPPTPPVPPVPPVRRPGVTASGNDGGEGNTPQEPQKKKNTRSIFIISFIFAVLACGIMYYFYDSANRNKEMEAYEYAMQSSDPMVLQSYLDTYKDADEAHRDSIMAHLDLLKQNDQDWTNAVVSGSKEALEAYLQKYPNSLHKQEALLKIDSLDWNVAKAADTADAYNPKVVQATMGSIARVNVTYMNLSVLFDSLPKDFPIYGTLLEGDNIYNQELTEIGLIVMGNEGKGISPAIRNLVNRALRIPNYPEGRATVDSLNVAIATAIVCAEFRRRF